MVQSFTPQASRVLQLVNKGKPDALQAILNEIKGGFQIDTALDPLDRCALILFAQKENHAGVTLCVKNGADFNAQDKYGRTALHYLVQSHDAQTTKLVEDLIEANNVTEFIDLNIATNSDVTALMLACKHGNSKMVQALLNGSASPFLKDQLGSEAIDYIISEVHDKQTKDFKEMINVAKA